MGWVYDSDQHISSILLYSRFLESSKIRGLTSGAELHMGVTISVLGIQIRINIDGVEHL